MSAVQDMLQEYRRLLDNHLMVEAETYRQAELRRLFQNGQLLHDAKLGNAFAQFEQAHLTVKSVLSRKKEDIGDFTTNHELQNAFGWFAAAMKQSYVRAFGHLAICYLDGLGTEVDGDAFEKLAVQAIQKGDFTLIPHLGAYYKEEERHEEAYPLLLTGMENDDKASFAHIGDYYKKGTIVVQDPLKAAQHYILGGALEPRGSGDACSNARFGFLELLTEAHDGVFSQDVSDAIIAMAGPKIRTAKIMQARAGKDGIIP